MTSDLCLLLRELHVVKDAEDDSEEVVPPVLLEGEAVALHDLEHDRETSVRDKDKRLTHQSSCFRLRTSWINQYLINAAHPYLNTLQTVLHFKTTTHLIIFKQPSLYLIFVIIWPKNDRPINYTMDVCSNKITL